MMYTSFQERPLLASDECFKAAQTTLSVSLKKIIHLKFFIFFTMGGFGLYAPFEHQTYICNVWCYVLTIKSTVHFPRHPR